MLSGTSSCACTQVRLDFLYLALNLCDELWPFYIIFVSPPPSPAAASSSLPHPPPFCEMAGEWFCPKYP